MLLRYGLLAAIVLTIVVSLVPSPSAALEVHESEEYWVEEPLPETPPLGLTGGRTDAPVADSIERENRFAAAAFLRIAVRRPIAGRSEIDEPVDLRHRRDTARHPRLIPALAPREDSTDPL
jgi:hypothetical protein